MSIEEKVKECNTLLGLANVIRESSDFKGEIQGSTKKFNAEKMAQKCENIRYHPLNVLTRNFGIREKALEILSDLEEQK